MSKLLPFFFFALFAGAVSAQIDFQTSVTFQQVKTDAAADATGAFVYIQSAWCVSCQIMDETTFQGESVFQELDGKYNTYKIDFDTENGKKWVEAFDICCLPTMLFFDSKGEQIQKVQAPLTSSALTGILKNPKSYNSKPVAQETFPPTEYDAETIVMEELSFSDGDSKSTEFDKPEEEIISPESFTDYSETGEVIDFFEQKNNATGEQKKGEFLYHLSNHIESLESLYIKYSVSEVTQLKDILEQVTAPAEEGQEIPVTSTRKYAGGLLFEDTEMLYELIQELKDWEDRLRDPEYDIRPVLVADNEKNSTGTEAPESFRVQMGYFKSEKFAKRMTADLEKSYDLDVEMKIEEQAKGTFYRVLLGRFDSEKEAKNLYKKVKKEGRKALLKKL